jgi:hypothetical protein
VVPQKPPFTLCTDLIEATLITEGVKEAVTTRELFMGELIAKAIELCVSLRGSESSRYGEAFQYACN